MVNTGGSVRQLPSRPHLDALTMSTAVEQFRKLLTGKVGFKFCAL